MLICLSPFSELVVVDCDEGSCRLRGLDCFLAAGIFLHAFDFGFGGGEGASIIITTEPTSTAILHGDSPQLCEQIIVFGSSSTLSVKFIRS